MNIIVQDFSVGKVKPLKLEAHARSYVYNEKNFRPLENLVERKIRAYDAQAGTGHLIADHLQRIAHNYEGFLLFKGYDPVIAHKLAMAAKLHDADKILETDFTVWRLTEEKPSENLKKQRAQHTRQGGQVIKDAMAELGMELSNDDKAHLKTILYMVETHHERLDGLGSSNLGFKGEDLDEPLSMLTILDEIDGKTKVRENDLTAIFTQLNGPKHSGKFKRELVKDCEDFCKQPQTFQIPKSPGFTMDKP